MRAGRTLRRRGEDESRMSNNTGESKSDLAKELVYKTYRGEIHIIKDKLRNIEKRKTEVREKLKWVDEEEKRAEKKLYYAVFRGLFFMSREPVSAEHVYEVRERMMKNKWKRIFKFWTFMEDVDLIEHRSKMRELQKNREEQQNDLKCIKRD